MEVALTGVLAALLILILPLAAISYQLPKQLTITLWLVLYAVLVFFDWLPTWIAVLSLLIYLLIVTFIYAKNFRQQKITRPFMRWFQHQLPTLTKVEREALDAGGLWWEAKLFRANPEWQALSQLSPLQLTAEEQSFLNNETKQLCQMIDDWEIVNELADMPKPVWDFIRSKGFLSFIIPKEYGGKGFSAYAHSCIVSRIATRSMSVAVNIMVPNSLGPAEFLIHFGTEAQKQTYLPRLAAGKEIPCFGLTAPEAGSDASAITDIGVVCNGVFKGKEMLGVRLNFNKRYITLAPVATLMGIAFKLYDPNHLLGDKKSIGITFALLPTNLPGIEIGKRHWPSQLAFMNGPIRGKDVFVPMDMMLGGEKYYGKGWQMMMECLAVGRGISLPALATAGSQFCARMSANYCQIRQQFNRSIGDFEGIGLKLGKMAGFALMAEATRRFTLRAIDDGIRPSIATAITKYHLTEMSRSCIIDAMDIHGGRAVQIGPSNYLHLLYNAAPTAITVEGANILTRNMIIFGQGAMRAHPYLADEIVAAGEEAVETFDTLLMKHADYTTRLFAKALGYGLTHNLFQKLNIQTPFQKQVKALQQMSHALALVSEATFVILGKKLKVSEAISARMGDILSYLYIGTSVISYFQEMQSPKALKIVSEWALDYCLSQIQTAFYEVFANFPKRGLGHLLKKVVFPWGGHFHGPKDVLTLALAEQMQTDAEVRDLLSQSCFLAKSTKEPVGLMEAAWENFRNVQPLLKKIEEAMSNGLISRQKRIAKSILEAAEKSIITPEEKAKLDQAADLIWQAIQVDEFESNQLARKVVNGKQHQPLSS